MPRSSAWRRWVLCGGKQIMTMPFSLAYSMACTDLWLAWPSSNKIAFLCWVGLTKATKWCSHLRKSLESVHPVLLAAPIVPSGAPLGSCSVMFTRGKIVIGGIYDPLTLNAHKIVMLFPRSPLVIFPTCFSLSWLLCTLECEQHSVHSRPYCTPCHRRFDTSWVLTEADWRSNQPADD